MRVYLVGTSGSGKSTLARQLAKELHLDHLELDSLYHQANWTPLPEPEFKSKVNEFVTRPNWVIDGNYSQVQGIILAECTHLVLLDYSRPVIMFRVIRRTLCRMLFRKELWNGNRESWRYLFTSNADENIVLWAWSTYHRRREGFAALAASVDARVCIKRLTRPAQARKLIFELRDRT